MHQRSLLVNQNTNKNSKAYDKHDITNYSENALHFSHVPLIGFVERHRLAALIDTEDQ
jgi:hypothetical protein